MGLGGFLPFPGAVPVPAASDARSSSPSFSFLRLFSPPDQTVHSRDLPPHPPRAFGFRASALERLTGVRLPWGFGAEALEAQRVPGTFGGAGQRRRAEGTVGFPERGGRPGVCPRQLCFSRIIKADQRAWPCRSRWQRGWLRSPVIKASACFLCPVGQRTSITAAPGNHGRRPGPSVRPDQRSQTLNLEGMGRLPRAETSKRKQIAPLLPKPPGPRGPRGALGHLGQGGWRPGEAEQMAEIVHGRRELSGDSGLCLMGPSLPRAPSGRQGPGLLQLRGPGGEGAAATATDRARTGPLPGAGVGRGAQTGPLSPPEVRARGNGISFQPFSPSASR